MFIPKFGLSNLRPVILSEKVSNVQDRLLTLPAFASVSPTVAQMQALIVILNNAISKAYQGTPADRELRDIAVEKIKFQFTLQVNSIVSLSNGDESLYLATGLEVRNSRTIVTSLNAPQNVMFVIPGSTGELLLKYRGVRHASGYDVYLGTDINNLQLHGHFSRNRVFITGLVPGTQYFAKVVALGSNNLSSPMSNAAQMRSI